MCVVAGGWCDGCWDMGHGRGKLSQFLLPSIIFDCGCGDVVLC